MWRHYVDSRFKALRAVRFAVDEFPNLRLNDGHVLGAADHPHHVHVRGNLGLRGGPTALDLQRFGVQQLLMHVQSMLLRAVHHIMCFAIDEQDRGLVPVRAPPVHERLDHLARKRAGFDDLAVQALDDAAIQIHARQLVDVDAFEHGPRGASVPPCADDESSTRLLEGLNGRSGPRAWLTIRGQERAVQVRGENLHSGEEAL
mmetsp:Transcript_25852/g.74501  ORF Transcript_25852/g.74501 Transcript_25852/m.74501 type:complete len:202 (+) Transcript_25852:2484-3089(+)